MLKLAQYPRNADGTPMDVEVAVLTDDTGNGGARLTTPPLGPDNAPIDAKALILVDNLGNLISLGAFSVSIPNRTALASYSFTSTAYLTEAGREGEFVWSSSNLATLVAADTAQGLYVASASDPTGASGAWVRKYSGPVNAGWFGLVEGDSSANGATNDAAMLALFATLKARSLNSVTNQRGFERCTIPYGTYWFASTIDLKDGALILEGMACPVRGTVGPILKFPAGVSGIRIQSTNTSGSQTQDGVLHDSGTGSVLRNLYVEGAFATALTEDDNTHGFHVRGTCTLDDCHARNFQGDGFRVAASTTSNGGNAVLTVIRNCISDYNRNGIYVSGNNTGASYFERISTANNRQWGLRDHASFNATHLAHHFEGNGVNSQVNGTTIPATVVSQGGNLYFCINGQEVGASTNAPSGTTADNTWWAYLSAGAPSASTPAWVSGISVRAGGSALTEVDGAYTKLVGCYAETGQGLAQLSAGTIVDSGQLSQSVWSGSTGVSTYGNSGDASIRTLGAYRSDGYIGTDETFWAALGEKSSTNKTILRFAGSTNSPSIWRLKQSAEDLILNYANSSSQQPFLITGPTTTQQFGTGVAVPYAFSPGILLIPNATGVSSNGSRRLTAETATPSTGTRAKGELSFNSSPSSTAPFGWRCTVTGTPGTWQSLYAMSGAQQTAWSAWTGTGSKASKAVSTATLADVAAAMKSLIDDLQARGVLA